MRAILAVAVIAFAPVARADTMVATLEQPIDEVAHTVDIRVVDGVATYVVQRQFHNAGKAADEARVVIDLPAGAAATGLRIRAKDRWYDGELLDRDKAAGQYRFLTGLGVHDPKDPALLFWLESNQLALQVFPVMPGGTSTIEYTLTVPVRYSDGKYWLTYPRAIVSEQSDARPLVQPRIVVHGAATIDGVVANGKPITLAATPRAAAPDLPPVFYPVNDNLSWISVAPPPIAVWTGRLGRAVASNKHVFTRLEVEAAPQLSQLPKRAQIVFVVDASYSIGDETLRAELAVAKAYAKHLPDAELEVVVYRRKAARVFGSFVAASDFARRLDDAQRKGSFALGNGSALDDAAKLAVGALARRAGPHRVVIVSDTLVRSSLSDADALRSVAALDPSAVVHVVRPVVGADETALECSDDDSLAQLARRHHGIFCDLSIAASDAATGELAPHVLELVRPTRITKLSASNEITVGETLREGHGILITDDNPGDKAPERVSLTGEIWSDRVRLDIATTAPFSRAAAAFVFSTAEHGNLDQAEMRKLAVTARAVSPVTSYLAIEPGVRPSKIGLPLEGGGTGWGTIGAGSYGTVGRGNMRGRRPPDLAALVETKRCVAKHKPEADWTVELEVETTLDEIADVQLQSPHTPFNDCIVEAVWSTRLDKQFDQQHESFGLALHP